MIEGYIDYPMGICYLATLPFALRVSYTVISDVTQFELPFRASLYNCSFFFAIHAARFYQVCYTLIVFVKLRQALPLLQEIIIKGDILDGIQLHEGGKLGWIWVVLVVFIVPTVVFLRALPFYFKEIQHASAGIMDEKIARMKKEQAAYKAARAKKGK